MDIKEILRQQSEWTWDVMMSSTRIGEMIREDAITSVNLTTINLLAQQNVIPLNIISFQGARLESEFGADWLWSLGQSGYLVQAKRLDVVLRDSLLSYTINIDQLLLLVDAAQVLSGQHSIDTKPAYVFYNSMIADGDPKEMGCLFVNAYILWNYLERKQKTKQASATLSIGDLRQLEAQPWYRMFSA